MFVNIIFASRFLDCSVWYLVELSMMNSTKPIQRMTAASIYSIEIIIFIGIYDCELVEKISKCPNTVLLVHPSFDVALDT